MKEEEEEKWLFIEMLRRNVIIAQSRS